MLLRYTQKKKHYLEPIEVLVCLAFGGQGYTNNKRSIHTHTYTCWFWATCVRARQLLVMDGV